MITDRISWPVRVDDIKYLRKLKEIYMFKLTWKFVGMSPK